MWDGDSSTVAAFYGVWTEDQTQTAATRKLIWPTKLHSWYGVDLIGLAKQQQQQ